MEPLRRTTYRDPLINRAVTLSLIVVGIDGTGYPQSTW